MQETLELCQEPSLWVMEKTMQSDFKDAMGLHLPLISLNSEKYEGSKHPSLATFTKEKTCPEKAINGKQDAL